ncbi:beta strand repeat-containing protein, partial [Photobacterium leiognathi]|uniref:beta strand repeat-containing protein n=1 Tax=Photobacterium leiognathi TaxID=553611 RepID=UPI001C632B58
MTTDTLSAIRGLNFISTNHTDYQAAIAGEAEIMDVAALQALIDSVDTSIVAFADVQTAATSSDASALTDTTFSNIRGLTFNNAHLTDYQGAIAAEAQIEDVAALQALIDSVDASIAAFASVQSAATNSDASTISTETLNAIRGLTFISANHTDYQAAIAEETSIADVTALQALIDSVDASLAAFASVQAAATNNNGATISIETLTAIRGLIISSDNLIDYQDAIAVETAITDVAALQALIDSVDASINAFSDVQIAATSNDATSVTIETLNAIRGLTINGDNVTDYQGAIAAESDILDVAALQTLIDSVDASLVAFGDVQAAASNSDASAVTTDTLSAIRGLIFISANHTDYQAAIAEETSIADVAALQALINSVDASVAAFAAVQSAVASSDASAIHVDTLSDIRGLSVIDANVADYQQAIESETAIVDVAALQALIDSVDASIVAFTAVQIAATSSDASAVTDTTLSAIRGLTFNGAHLTDYQGAIAGEAEITDVAALQTLIDSVDASLAALASVQTAATDSDASGINVTLLTQIRGLTLTSGHILDYRSAIEEEAAIADVAALQALIDSVDASLAAFASVQLAATGGDASALTDTTFSNIRGLTFNNAHLTDYQGAIAAESDIIDVTALQALIDSVDASLAAFGEVQSAATNSDAQAISIDTLNTIRGLTFDPGHITDYQAAIASETEIADEAALQALLDSVDASLDAFTSVQMAATNSDGSGIDVSTLNGILGLTFNGVNLTAYQDAIASETGIADVAALQALIDSVDASLAAFGDVQTAADDSDAESITLETLSAIRDLAFIDDNLSEYQSAIADQTSVDSVEALQALIHQVDESVQALADINTHLNGQAFESVSVGLLEKVLALDDSIVQANEVHYQIALAGQLNLPLSSQALLSVIQDVNTTQLRLNATVNDYQQSVALQTSLEAFSRYSAEVTGLRNDIIRLGFSRMLEGVAEREYNLPGEYLYSDGNQLKLFNTSDGSTLFLTPEAIKVHQIEVVFDSNAGSNVFVVDGDIKPTLTLAPGVTYYFDQSASSNANHPIAFASDNNQFSVSSVGVPGQNGAYTTLTLANADNANFSYYCELHGAGMGNAITSLAEPVAYNTSSPIYTDIGVLASVDKDTNTLKVNNRAVNVTRVYLPEATYLDFKGFDFNADTSGVAQKDISALTLASLDHINAILLEQNLAASFIDNALSTDANLITYEHLASLVTLFNVQQALVPNYITSIVDSGKTSLTYGFALQSYINAANGDDTLISIVNDAIANATTLSQADWETGGLLADIETSYLPEYQSRLVGRNDFRSVSGIQDYIDDINTSNVNFTLIQNAAQANDGTSVE